MFARPKIDFEFEELKINPGVVSGLLVQAKRKKHGEASGKLTQNQEERLANRLAFTSILLYVLEDTENRMVAPFRWHICREESMEQLIEWLKNESSSVDKVIDTAELLRQLANDSIGTNDRTTIDEVISPIDARAMKIEIKWKDGRGPTCQIRVLQKSKEETKVHVYLHR